MWKGVLASTVVVVAILFIWFGNRPPAPVVPGPVEPGMTQPAADDPHAKATLDHLGKPALDWNIPAKYWMNANGKQIHLGDLTGKVTMIEFFRIDCPHCKAAAPDMIDIYNKLKTRGLNVVAFQAPGDPAEESNWSTVQSTLRDWKIPYPVAFDEGSREFKKNGFLYYPTVIVLDKQGVVRFAQWGYDDKGIKRQSLLDALHKMLGLPLSPNP